MTALADVAVTSLGITGGGGVFDDELAPDDGGEPAEKDDGEEDSDELEEEAGTGRGAVPPADGYGCGALRAGCAGSNSSGDAVTVL